VIANLDDGNASATPDLAYTGVTSLDLRLSLFFMSGGRLTDFGEKQNDRRLELRMRYFFLTGRAMRTILFYCGLRKRE